MKLEPYILFGGVEVANALRTLTYLRRGLAGGNFSVGVANPLVVAEGGGYSDIYHDEYSAYLDSYRAPNLTCYCRTIDSGPYESPAYDQAPWYDVDRPESGEFYGLLIEASLAPVGRRPVSQRVGGGASVGALSLGPRLVQVSGEMYASSRAAMAYGERWLARALAGGAGCGADTVTILPGCAPDDVEDDAGYLRELAGVGIIEGPLLGAIDEGVPECLIQGVAFQLAASDSYLRRVAAVLTAAIDGGEDCVTLTASDLVADAAAVLTFTAGVAPLDNVVVTVTAGADESTFAVVDMPALSVLVVDSSRRTVELADADGAVIGGLDVVDFAGVFPWLTAGPGESLEVCVDAAGATFGAGASVRVDQVDREL